MPSDEAILDVTRLRKTFGRVATLTDITIQIHAGEIFGLLGLNGAGKTTLLRCLVGLLRPAAGTIRFHGRPLTPSDIHRQIGYLPERFEPPPDLSGLELLSALSRTVDHALDPKTVLEWVGLLNHGRQRIRTYSHGMVQRLGLALALVKNPAVLMIDEPFAGLDVAGQRQLVALLTQLNQRGKTILFSSHLLVACETYAHRIGVLHHGQFRFVGTAEVLCHKHGVGSLEEAFCKEVGVG